MKKRLFETSMLMLLLAFVPVAAFAQYNTSVPDVIPQQSKSDSVPQTQPTQQGTPTPLPPVNQPGGGSTVSVPGLYYNLPMYQQRESVRDRYYETMRTKRHIERVDRGAMKNVFVPKGMWMTGATVNYRGWENENQNLLILKDLDMDGHTFSVSPALGYFVVNNIAIGARYSYSRNYFYLGNLDLSLGEDLNISLDDLYYLEHKHTGGMFVRTYMSLFGSKLMGFFSEVRATYSQANGKNSTGRRDEDLGINTLDGTYEKVHSVQLGFTPGLCAFMTDFMAVECSIGMLGIDYKWSDYKNLHPDSNEYEYGKSRSGGANFRFNLFSVNIGLTFYL